MSLVRNAANKIAGWVVRYASNGSKEWAQAIESELLYTESDWHALAWALGGIRVLFNIQPCPIATIAALDREVQKYADRRRHSVNNGWLITNLPMCALLLWAVQLLIKITSAHDILSSTIELSGVLLTVPLVYQRTREPNVPDRDDQAGLIRFYVEELSATSSNSMTFWMCVTGALLMFIGYELLKPRWLSFLLLPLFIAMEYLLARQRISGRRRLAQVKALLDTTSSD